MVMTIDLGEDSIEFRAWRNPNGGKFAPFIIEIEGVKK